MNIFTLKATNTVFLVNKKNYHEQTARDKKYIIKDSGGPKLYAICPACDNPIQIIERKNNNKSITMYARHAKQNIPNVAIYDQAAYDSCFLSNPKIMSKGNNRRKNDSKEASEIYNKIKENFEILIQIIRRKTGISFNYQHAEDMLKDFVSYKGHTYEHINLLNIPYAFMYLIDNINIENCYVDNEIVESIKKNSQDFYCDNFKKINKKTKSLKEIVCFFSEHTVADHTKLQTIRLNIVEKENKNTPENSNKIYSKIINIEFLEFDQQINSKSKLLGIAKNIM